MADLTLRPDPKIRFHVTVRTHAQGKGGLGLSTGLRDKVTVLLGFTDPRTNHDGDLTIWIHGYNNSQEAITETWQKTAAALVDRGIPVDNVVAFYWPGDQWANPFISAAAYPYQVSVARAAAAKLASYFSDPSVLKPLRLRFVAHSLGCLVALETVAILQQNNLQQLSVEGILLMAAAVPQVACVRGLGPYDRRAGISTEDRVLYSIHDRVLCYAFRPGQQIAQLCGWAEMPSVDRAYLGAVGRDGGPPRRWSKDPMPGFDHGDYWTASAVCDEMIHLVGARIGRLQEATPKAQAVPDRRVNDRVVGVREEPRRHSAVVDWRAEMEPAGEILIR